MRKRHYKWYSTFYRLNDRIERKFTTTGKVLVLCAFALVFFGLNTRVSMLFVVFAASVALLLTDAISLKFKSFGFEFERFLPECTSIGTDMKYPVILRKKDEKANFGNLFYTEIPAAPMPTFEVFNTTKEPGEEKRNAFDRKMGYYRWKWLVAKNCGGKYEEFAVTGRKTDGGILFDVSFLPERRGKITFGGAYIFHKGIFGLLKKGKIISNPGSFLVLPEIKESFEIPENEGNSVNEKNEKTREMQETGSGFELRSLRDFVPGDSMRTIHWKSSAKSGQLRTKEFYKEVDSGSILFIDNFFEEHYSEDFEKILSAAASLLNAMQNDENLPQILFVGRENHEIPDSSKKSFASALAMLALAENDAGNKFESCLETLFEAGRNANSLFFFTSKYDEARKRAMKTLAALDCAVHIFYAGSAESDSELSRYETKIDF